MELRLLLPAERLEELLPELRAVLPLEREEVLPEERAVLPLERLLPEERDTPSRVRVAVRLATEREAVLEAEVELRDTELRVEPPRLTWLREAPLP